MSVNDSCCKTSLYSLFIAIPLSSIKRNLTGLDSETISVDEKVIYQNFLPGPLHMNKTRYICCFDPQGVLPYSEVGGLGPKI